MRFFVNTIRPLRYDEFFFFFLLMPPLMPLICLIVAPLPLFLHAASFTRRHGAIIS